MPLNRVTVDNVPEIKNPDPPILVWDYGIFSNYTGAYASGGFIPKSDECVPARIELGYTMKGKEIIYDEGAFLTPEQLNREIDIK